MWTLLLIILPLIGALVTFALRGDSAKWCAYAVAVAELVLTGIVGSNLSAAPNSLELKADWMPALGASWHIGMDGISFLMVLLTNFLVPIIIYAGMNKSQDRQPLLYGLILLMQAAMVGVFVAKDALLYYIFWEMALIPIFFIIQLWGGEDRTRINIKFFIYTLFGSLFMLLSILYVQQHSPDKSFSIANFYNNTLSAGQQAWVFAGFFLAYAVKIPLFPFHTWQPSTYTVAPNQGTMLLSGIMLKMGLYSLLRWVLPVVPLAVVAHQNLAIGMGVIGIVYASWIAVTQTNLKRLFAYSSIAHVGLIAAGIFTLSYDGIKGSLIQMVSHGINVVGLFFVAEVIERRLGTLEMSKMGGIREQAPKFAASFLIVLLASVALPITNGFIGEFLLLKSVFSYNAILGVVAGLTIIFGAVYMLRGYRTAMLGEIPAQTKGFSDLNNWELEIFIALAAVIFIIGIFPNSIFSLVEADIKHLLQIIQAKI
jgi:NADH-quinone oxidoreductase subunit M